MHIRAYKMDVQYHWLSVILKVVNLKKNENDVINKNNYLFNSRFIKQKKFYMLFNIKNKFKYAILDISLFKLTSQISQLKFFSKIFVKPSYFYVFKPLKNRSMMVIQVFNVSSI